MIVMHLIILIVLHVLKQMNLFVYCSNNPIAIIDSNGKFGFLATLLIGAEIGTIVNVASQILLKMV